MPDIFINTERPVDRSIVAGLNQPQREAASSAWVAGSSYDVNLYFVQNDGSYDAASGQAGQTVELAIAPVSEPESGTFTLTDGTDTTAAISYGASGQDVEDALNALNSDTGPNLGTASLVDVEKVSDTQYAITFRTLGAMTALSGNTVSLYPESTVTGSIAVTGSGTVYAQQVIEVVRQPAIYQPTWSTITNGFNATVALNTTRLLQAMILERGEPFYLEVRLNGTTVAREVVTVEESNMPASAFSGTAIASVLDAFAADPTSNAYFDADAWSAVLSIAAGNGDVVGPASAVDSNFAAFDSTTGKLIKDALVSASSFATAAQGALADSASQPGHTHTASDVTDFDTEVSNNTTVAGNEAYTPRVLSGTAKVATFTAVIGETHLINTSGGGFTANLPAIASGQGRIAFLFTGTGGNLTVDPDGAETIGGKATLRLDHGHNTIENDGTEWKLVQRSGVAPFRIDPAQITGNQDGYNPADWNNNVTHLFIDSDASREIQGFEEDGFHDMAQVIVTNDGANDIIIKHDTSTTVANRVLVDGGADFTLGANQSGILMRDGTVNKWRFYGISSGGGGGSVANDTLWDAAGDLAIGTGVDAATRLAIGTNGQVLTSNGTTAVWAAAGAADNLGNHTATQDLNMAGFNVDSADSIYLDEKAAADVDVVGDGQLWVKDSAPNLLMFTDDAGNDGQVINDFTTVYDYIFVPAGAAIPRTTNGAEAGTPAELATNDIMLENLAFDTATEEAAGFWITLPLGWDAGTIKIKPYWTAASGSGTVKWDFAARAYADDDAIDQALGTEQGVTDTLLLANDMHIAPTTSALTIGGTPVDGEPFYLQVARDVATDTLGVDALLIGFSIEFARKVKLATAL